MMQNFSQVNRGTSYDNLSQLPKRIKKYAQFASAAYKPDAENLRGYNVDLGLSTDQFRVYVKPKKRKIILAIRGSTVFFNDWVVNDAFGIARGAEHKQLGEAKEILKKIRQKYHKYKITATGHSLGAATAAMLAADDVKIAQAYAFNPGSSFLGGAENRARHQAVFKNPRLRTIIKEGDVVSASAVEHVPDDLLHVIRKHAGENVAGRHLMSNFTDEIPVRQTVYRSTPGDAERLRKLYLERLPAGGLYDQDKAINDGAPTGGGFHAQYHAKNNLITLQGHETDVYGNELKFPGPGAKVYIDTINEVRYFFDKKGKPVFFPYLMKDKAAALRSANKYGEGPTVFVDVNDPEQKQVAFVRTWGGEGMRPLPANTDEDWYNILTAEDRQNDHRWFAGQMSDVGYVGNAFVNPYVEWHQMESTQSDFAARVVGAIIPNTKKKAGLAVLDYVAGEAASAMYGPGGLVAQKVFHISATLIDGHLERERAIHGADAQEVGSRRGDYYTYLNYPHHADMFEFPGKKLVRPNSNLDRDDSLQFFKKELRKLKNQVKKSVKGVKLTKEEKAKWASIRNFKVDQSKSPYEQRQQLLQLSADLRHASAAVSALKTMQDLDIRARSFGLGDVTTEALRDISKLMLTDAGTSDMHPDTQFMKLFKNTHDILERDIRFARHNAQYTFFTEYARQQNLTKTALHAKLNNLRGKYMSTYTGRWNDFDERFEEEKWKLYHDAYGGEFDTSMLASSKDRYFVEEYLQSNPHLLEGGMRDNFLRSTPAHQYHSEAVLHRDAMIEDRLKRNRTSNLPEVRM